MTAQYTALDSFNNLISAFNLDYQEAMEKAWSVPLTMVLPSTRSIENLDWIGAARGMRVWEGGRQEVKPNKYTLEITNQDFESTTGFYVRDLVGDKTNLLEQQVTNLAQKAANHRDELIASKINTNGVCYDGQNFFDTDHDESGTNQVNALTATQVPSANVATASAPTATEMANILLETVAHHWTITDDQGDTMNGQDRQFTIIVPTVKMYTAAQLALTQQNLVSGASNPLTGILNDGIGFNIRFLPTGITALGAADQFVVTASGSNLQPFIYQEHTPLQESTKDDTFQNKRHLFGLFETGAAAYGFWQKAMRVTLS